MAPQLDIVAEKLGDKIRVLKVDADEEDQVASALQIRGLPTVLLINDMAVVARMEGALMADDIMQLVRADPTSAHEHSESCRLRGENVPCIRMASMRHVSRAAANRLTLEPCYSVVVLG